MWRSAPSAGEFAGGPERERPAAGPAARRPRARKRAHLDVRERRAQRPTQRMGRIPAAATQRERASAGPDARRRRGRERADFEVRERAPGADNAAAGPDHARENHETRTALSGSRRTGTSDGPELPEMRAPVDTDRAELLVGTVRPLPRPTTRSDGARGPGIIPGRPGVGAVAGARPRDREATESRGVQATRTFVPDPMVPARPCTGRRAPWCLRAWDADRR
jgi:hypothetical protein